MIQNRAHLLGTGAVAGCCVQSPLINDNGALHTLIVFPSNVMLRQRQRIWKGETSVPVTTDGGSMGLSQPPSW